MMPKKKKNLTAESAVEAKMLIFGLHVEVLLLLLNPSPYHL